MNRGDRLLLRHDVAARYGDVVKRHLDIARRFQQDMDRTRRPIHRGRQGGTTVSLFAVSSLARVCRKDKIIG